MMKTNDFVYFSLIKLIRNKKNIFLILLYVCCTIILLCGMIFRDNFSNYIYNTITKNIGFRSILVSPDLDKEEDYGLSKIKNINHVIDVYSSNYDFISVLSDFKDENYDGYLDLSYGNDTTLPENIIGERIDSNDTGKAICPISFFPSSEAANLIIDEKKIIDGHKLLNTSFEVTYYSYAYENKKTVEKDEYKKTFEIVGLYDSTAVINPSNTCYISSKDIIEMKNTSKLVTDDDSTVFGFVVVVDEKENVNKVANELIDLGFFQPTIKNQLDTSITNIILLSCNILISVIMFAVIMLTIFYARKKTAYIMKEIGILRTCGYRKQEVVFYNSLDIGLTNVISYLLGTMISLGVYFILKNTILKGLIYSGFKIRLFSIDFIFVFFIIVIICSAINIFHILKISKMSITNLMGGGQEWLWKVFLEIE